MPLMMLKLMQKLQTQMISSFKRLLILPTLRFRIEDEFLSEGVFKLGSKIFTSRLYSDQVLVYMNMFLVIILKCKMEESIIWMVTQ